MANKPEISIVLGSYNRLDFLKLAIDSVRNEIEGMDCEIIVIDGGSTDGAMEWLIQQKDIITIVQHNSGEWLGKKVNKRSWAYFMNLGFKCAQGKYICMISDDCLIVPGAIRNGYAVFEEALNSGEKVGAVAFYWRDWPIEIEYEVRLTLGEKMYVNHGMYLREALAQVGFVDEDNFKFYFADGDLCLKMWYEGYKCIDAPNSYIEHCAHVNMLEKKSNISGLDIELEKYKNKWRGIFYDDVNNNSVYTRIKKSYQDMNNIAEKFREHYEECMLLFKKEIEQRKRYAIDRVKDTIDLIDIHLSVVVYGAGVHTEMLFKYTDIERKNVVGIVDSHKCGEMLDHYKINRPDFILDIKPDIIIISSFAFQNQICSYLSDVLGYGGQIIKLYNELDTESFYTI